MALSSRIVQLSTQIQDNTAEVDAYLLANNIVSPSLDASCPPVLDLPPEVSAKRDAALEAMDELQQLLRGPVGTIYTQVTDHTSLVSLHAACRFNMPSTFPPGSTSTIPEIAKASNMHPSDAERVIRHGIAHHLFKEPERGVIAHSATSKALAVVPWLREWTLSGLNTMWPGASRLVDMMERWPASQEPNETAFSLAHNTDSAFFEELAKDGRKAKIFADGMTFFLNMPQMSIVHAVEGYDWSQHSFGTIVDVGGSHGSIALSLANIFPAMKVIVQDRPEVIADAPKDAKPGQVEFQVHDFFSEQPVKDADVYFYRWIFHDWSDKYCVKILRNLIPALKKSARVVLMDSVVPEPGVLTPYQERPVKLFDMVMKVLFNAKERNETDWRELVQEADERFRVVDVRRPVGSQLGIVVVEWEG
ncbi:S-adenosyl-L-methionine-dependent methyltransferase [Lindgomyces ingoldianus]|uniref:S-adenosyl-L-methionine-dependent methyltransferase n=1 Tax=Lindgomyces ingoldianus TaxID=673940 RepID=A0ACB6R594_9PLEO|nr:S-adenosyl-L-methionine-dependent methyltransferase [Lindgomyces ingoldianus]KAF2474448.1 S-adenosyl-L-methionine-dependent methyltransferase [Lindgomyces ingoldianus]